MPSNNFRYNRSSVNRKQTRKTEKENMTKYLKVETY